jgi:hypothetical protein
MWSTGCVIGVNASGLLVTAQSPLTEGKDGRDTQCLLPHVREDCVPRGERHWSLPRLFGFPFGDG